MISCGSAPCRQIDVTPRLRGPSWRWMTLSDSPRARAQGRGLAVVWWAGSDGARRPVRRAGAGRRGRRGLPGPAAGAAAVDAEPRTDRHGLADLEPGLELLKARVVHADVAPVVALAAAQGPTRAARRDRVR